MATPEQISDAQLEALAAEKLATQDAAYRHVSWLATLIFCDEPAGKERTPAAATAKAIAIYKGTVAEMQKPGFWGAS